MKLKLLLVILLALSFLRCATDQTEMGTSSKIPAAQGIVNIRAGKNDNTQIDLRVNHLAEATKIDSGASTYVVWTKPLSGMGKVQSLGALEVNQNLEGKLSTVTPLRNFELFVTAEADSEVQDPTGEHLLWAKIIR